MTKVECLEHLQLALSHISDVKGIMKAIDPEQKSAIMSIVIYDLDNIEYDLLEMSERVKVLPI